jgi:hypothetical protein
MDKETAASELNVYVSSPNGSRTKETTFREWVVNNQIGTLLFYWTSWPIRLLAVAYNPAMVNANKRWSP